MIGEFNFGGVFVPALLLGAVSAFCLTSVARFCLRRLHLYRFVWHAGLFDVALFVVMLWVLAAATTAWNIAGGK